MENNELKLNTNVDELLKKIEDGKITAHSKNYFRIRVILLILSLIFIFITSILLCSFILFSLRVSGEGSLIGFGNHGLLTFVKLFPWGLFFLDAFLILFAGWLSRSFRFGYKIPVLYLAIGVITIMTLGGIAIDQGTPLHYFLLKNAENHNLPVFENMYRKVRRPPPYAEGIYRGIITSANDNVLIVEIESEADETTSSFNVILPSSQKTNSIKIGDNIFISGEMENGNIHASVVQIAPRLPCFEKCLLGN